MGNADFGFLVPMFELADSLINKDEAGNSVIRLREIGADSTLSGDDADLDGMWVSKIVTDGINAALDHVVCLRSVVMGAGEVTNNAPWTLLRGVLEPASVAVWVMAGGSCTKRRERALRVWYYDFTERQKWEDDSGGKPVAPAKSGRQRAADIVSLARRHGLRENQVTASLSYGDSVAAAGKTVGWQRADATARWREAAAFAHGRTWPTLQLSSPTGAELILGGYGISMTVNEARLAELARLANDVLHFAIDEYGHLSK